jgi:hypothetical protein
MASVLLHMWAAGLSLSIQVQEVPPVLFLLRALIADRKGRGREAVSTAFTRGDSRGALAALRACGKYR